MSPPFSGLYYYVVNSQKPPFSDKRVRQALSMAINREVIGPQILGTGELPAYSWVPPGTANYGEPAYVSWKDLPYSEKVAEAKKLLTEAGFGPDKPLHAVLSYNTNDNHKRIAVAIASMWKPLGVDVEPVNAETKVHYDQMQRGQVEIGRAGWLADYNDPDNFLNLPGDRRSDELRPLVQSRLRQDDQGRQRRDGSHQACRDLQEGRTVGAG
ncbi:ABC transporter substrate-binding protein [Rhizobium beringeri]